MEAFKHNSGDTLFDGDITVRIVENGTALSASSANSLKLLVQLHNRTSASKELLVRLTDSQDPLMLYTCVVCEEDYQSLRQHQGLLVDFTAFPHKFVELVNSCIRENQTNSPKFLLVLRCNGDGGGVSSLEVVEVNIFKHLCHLALTLAPASTQLKLAYLADCCKSLKGEVGSKEREATENEHQLKQQIRHMQDIIAKTSQESQQLRAKLEEQSALSAEKHTQFLSQERDKLLKLQSDADRKADRERKDLEARMNYRIEQLQTKVTSLSTQNNDISERRHRAESTVKELRGRLSSVEGELERCRQELSHTKRQKAHLDKDYQSKCKLSRDLETRTAHLEAELMTKETSFAHTHQLVETLQQQKVGLEEALEERRQKLAKRENSIQLLYAELQKSLDIIKKLQKKVQEEHMRSKVRGAALLEQDKVVGEKDSKVTRLNDNLQEVTTKVSQLTLDNDKLQTELHEAVEKLQEQEKTLKTNENVIAWLNKQLNEAEVAGAVVKRAPLTEAYLPSHGLSSHGLSGAPHRILSHSTPLSSNTAHSFPSGWSGGTHATTSSVHHLGNIPPIPEEISPRYNEMSPPDKNISPPHKENTEGLDPKYLEATNTAAVPVRGLLRANYDRPVHSNDGRRGKQDKDKVGGNDYHRGRGKSSGKGNMKSAGSNKKPDLITKKQSSYFPKS